MNREQVHADGGRPEGPGSRGTHTNPEMQPGGVRHHLRCVCFAARSDKARSAATSQTGAAAGGNGRVDDVPQNQARRASSKSSHSKRPRPPRHGTGKQARAAPPFGSIHLSRPADQQQTADPPFRRRCRCVRCWGSSDAAHPIHGPVVRALPPCGASDGLVPSGSIRFGRGRAPGLGFLVKHRRSVQADPAPLDHHTSSLLCASRTTPSNPSRHPHVSVTTVTPHQHTVDNHRSNRFTCTHNRSTAALD